MMPAMAIGAAETLWSIADLAGYVFGRYGMTYTEALLEVDSLAVAVRLAMTSDFNSQNAW